MNPKDKLQQIQSKLKQLQPINTSMVTTLYTLTQKSLPTALIFTILIAIFLYSELSYTIVIWASLMITVILLRLYDLYLFKTNFQRYSLATWHNKFMLSVLLLALLVSSLSFVFIPYLNEYNQLFVLASLVGITAGGTTSLAADFRIAIVYVSIIMLPLIGSLLMIHSSPGNILAMLMILFFISQVGMIHNNYTEQKKIKALKEQQDLLNNIFSESPLAMFSYDIHMNITYANKHVYEIFGQDSTIIGMNLDSFQNSAILNIFNLALTKGHQSYVGSYIAPNGTFFWINITAFSFKDRDNTILGGVGIIKNKTEEYRDKEELEVLHITLQEQVEKNQTLLEENKLFIADMVHQIRTPLTVIMTNTSLIEMQTELQNSSCITQIHSAINMLSNSYEDLSYIISNDRIEYTPIEIDFTKFLNERVHFFDVIANANNKTISTDISNDIKITINDTELERLIDNNLSNAIKHSYDKSEIEIVLEKTNSEIILKFISKGPNIQNVSKIFDKDYTESYGAKRSLGLGLNMVKNICEKNHIKYSVHSKDNINTFTYIFKR